MELDHLERLKNGLYKPIMKGKGFNPNPVAGNIPMHADSVNNPSCVGTRLYTEFWNEQIKRCIEGYNTGGIHIPGRYYFFLNFMIVKGPTGPQYPWMVDFDLEFWQLNDWVKKNKKAGIIGPKGRRKGLSEFEKNIINYGIRFIPAYKSGISAGQDTYVNGLMDKFTTGFDNVPPELSISMYSKNDKDGIIHFGPKIKDNVGNYKKGGFGGVLMYKTMYDKQDKHEGEYFVDYILEEMGNYNNSFEVYNSIQPALKRGNDYEGTFYMFGTGDQITSNSKDFKYLKDFADQYDLVPIFISARRKYFPCFVNPVGKYTDDPLIGEKINGLRYLEQMGYKGYQMKGMEDTKAAEELINSEVEKLKRTKNKKRLKEFMQNNPLEESQVWISGGSNNFDDEIIYDQLLDIDDSKLKRYILEYKTQKDKDGREVYKFPLEVSARPANDKTPDSKVVYIHEFPKPHIKDLDVGGVDSYNEDQTNTSDSLGAIYVGRRYDKFSINRDKIGRTPICEYYERPRRKEDFYDMCLKISIFYNLRRNTMVSAEYDNIIDYYLSNGGKKYLAPRPKSLESPNSRKIHPYGMKMDVHTKPRCIGITQAWVLDDSHYCFFPRLLRDLLAYDEEKIDSDWDGADAWMLALARMEDMKGVPRRQDKKQDESLGLPKWEYDGEGNVVMNNDDSENRPMVDSVGGWEPTY